MWDRQSRFDTQPGDIKIPSPALYPTKPVVPMTRWCVRMVVEGHAWRDQWRIDQHVWAYSSADAVLRARADFYGTWATADDRQRLPLRVLEVLQEGV